MKPLITVLLAMAATTAMAQTNETMQTQVQLVQQERTTSVRSIGRQFTDMAMADTEGAEHKLSEWCGKGRYVLIDFWASWCGPCRAEMPNVVACYEKYHDRGLDIIGISFDQQKAPWLKAIESLNMPWIHLSDLKGWNSLGSQVYGIRSIPANILLDGEGKIIANDLRGEMLGAKLAEVLREK